LYNFASLAGKCLTTPPFWDFGGFEPIKIVGPHPNPQKAYPWVSTHRLSHKWLKSVQGSTWAELREKSTTRTGQDRTIKKSQKRNISHILEQAPRKAIAMKFGTGVDVHEVVTWESRIFKIQGV